MTGNSAVHRQQQLYWAEMISLKVGAAYIRRYRDSLAVWVRTLAILKAVASSGAIAGWVVWKEYAFIWGAIIATAQLADALKEALPFAKLHKAASEHTITLNSLFIDSQVEWENIYAGHYTNEEITTRIHRLMKVRLEAEAKTFPEGLPEKSELFALAEKEAANYIKTTYGIS